MPRKIKLNLNDLKVQSFVTALNEYDKAKIKGGTDTADDDCDTSTCRTCYTRCTCDTACGGTCMPSYIACC